MNSEIILELISVSLIASVISSQLVQKIKEIFNFCCLFNKIISIFISFGVGFSYSYSFYSDNILYSIWIGLFTLIGAEGLYKALSGKFGLNSVSNQK